MLLLLGAIITAIIAVLAILGVLPYGFFLVIFLPFISTGGILPRERKTVEEKPVLFCPNCGFPLRGYENFCPRCGARLR